jgi:hypothetical protein
MDESETVIKVETDLLQLVREIQPFCDAGMVADIGLTDGSEVAVVLIGVSSSALIVDRWDDQTRGPAGDPFTLALDVISQAVIP